MSKRISGLLANKRLSHRLRLEGLYAIAQRQVARERAQTLVVAIDPVNFEKPSTQQLPGVSTVHKSTPPTVDGQARRAFGYPAITATVTNLSVPVITSANWFSYTLDACQPELGDRASHSYHPCPLSPSAGALGRREPPGRPKVLPAGAALACDGLYFPGPAQPLGRGLQ